MLYTQIFLAKSTETAVVMEIYITLFDLATIAWYCQACQKGWNSLKREPEYMGRSQVTIPKVLTFKLRGASGGAVRETDTKKKSYTTAHVHCVTKKHRCRYQADLVMAVELICTESTQ